MRFEITFKLDNAAFGDWPEGEAARILREIARRVEKCNIEPKFELNVRDINGNTIGKVRVYDRYTKPKE